jgi:hypothetical protein
MCVRLFIWCCSLPKFGVDGGSDNCIRIEILKRFEFKDKNGKILTPKILKVDTVYGVSVTDTIVYEYPMFRGRKMESIHAVLESCALPIKTAPTNLGQKLKSMSLGLVYFLRYIMYYECWPVFVYKMIPFKLETHYAKLKTVVAQKRLNLSPEQQIEILCYVLLKFATAARHAEMANLTVKDVRTYTPKTIEEIPTMGLLLRSTKNGDAAFLNVPHTNVEEFPDHPCPTDMLVAHLGYRNLNSAQPDDPLFPSLAPGRKGYDTALKWFKYIDDKLTTHSTRHGILQFLAESGISQEEAKLFGRWKTISAFLFYWKPVNEISRFVSGAQAYKNARDVVKPKWNIVTPITGNFENVIFSIDVWGFAIESLNLFTTSVTMVLPTPLLPVSFVVDEENVISFSVTTMPPKSVWTVIWESHLKPSPNLKTFMARLRDRCEPNYPSIVEFYQDLRQKWEKQRINELLNSFVQVRMLILHIYAYEKELQFEPIMMSGEESLDLPFDFIDVNDNSYLKKWSIQELDELRKKLGKTPGLNFANEKEKYESIISKYRNKQRPNGNKRSRKTSE